MKTILTLIITAFTLFASAQVPADAWIIGTWINQGYGSEGSFYPVNSWNAEKITFNADYTYTKISAQIDNYQLKNVVSEGKWNYTAEGKKLRLFSGEERHSGNGQVIVFDKEYDVEFQSKNYFTLWDVKGSYSVETRFQREGAVQTFEDAHKTEAERQADLALKYNPDVSYFYIVNSLKPQKKRKLYFDDAYFSIYIDKRKDQGNEIESTTAEYTGTIKNFNDTTIVLDVYDEDIRVYYHNGSSSSINNNYDYDPVLKEIRFDDLFKVYDRSKTSFSSITPITFTVSAITTLLVAPLVSIGYKGKEFNQDRYLTTAGIGLIGMGACIPLSIIFRDKPIQLIRPGEQTGKRNWYLEKVPR